nr:hypothetical protein [Tanacetum cinerariifolium]
TFLTDKENLGSPTKKDRKDKPHVIPYCQFTKLIICHLGRIHNIHQRSTSPFHLAEEDLRLGNLKFVPKCKVDEVFGIPIPNELISNNIINAPDYNAYLEMVAKHDQKVAAKKEGKKKTASAKQPKSKPAIEKPHHQERPSKASTTKIPKPKPAKEKSTKTTPPQQVGKGKIAKVRKVKSPFQEVDEPDEEPAQSEPEPELEHQGEGDRDDMEHAIQMSLESLQWSDTEILQIDEEQGKDVDEQVNLEEKTDELDQGQARSEPSRTLESRTPPEQVVMDEDQAGQDPEESRGALAGPVPEPMHNKFMANLYPKNLEDAYAFRDQFINDKSTEDEPEKPNVEAEVVSMVTVLIYQASSSVPSLSTSVPVIDLLPPKHASSTTQRSTSPFHLAEEDLRLGNLKFVPKCKVDEVFGIPIPNELISNNIINAPDYNAYLEMVAKHDQKVAAKKEGKKKTAKKSTKTTPPQQVGKGKIAKVRKVKSPFQEVDEPDEEPAQSEPEPELEHQGEGDRDDMEHSIQMSLESLQKFYIDRYITDSSHKVVRFHMRILTVVSIKAYSRYRYDYLKEITLRRADYQEYIIAEKDFKNLHPGNFEDLDLLLLQGHLNHLFGSEKRFEYKHDYIIIESPRAVVFPVRNNKRKVMRFNEIYKFSDGTLTNIMEALDYRVKEYKVNRLNPGMNTRFWTDKDVSRSKEFIHAIKQRLKTRRIFRNLECFNIRVTPKYHKEDGNPSRANIKQALGR